MVIYSWKKIVRASLPLLMVCACIEIFAGQLLQSRQMVLVALPIFLMAIPVINGVGGNVGSVLGARIASGLHIGSISLDVKDKLMRKNLVNAVVIGIVIYAILGIIIYLISSIGGIYHNVGIWKFVLVILGTGAFLIVMVSVASVVTAFVAFRRGLDPDDMVAPVVTTVGDMFGIVLLFLMMGVFGLV